MRNLITLTLLLSLITAATGGETTAEPKLTSNAASGQVQGLLSMARLLLKSPEKVEQRTFATVMDSQKSEAPDVPFRDWRDAAAKQLLTERPARYQLKLAATDMGVKLEANEQKVIGWKTDYAANKVNVWSSYPNRRFAVIPNPYLKGSVLSYEPPLQGEDLNLNPTLWMLPTGSLPELVAAMVWRKERASLFGPIDSDKLVPALTELRGELGNKNAYRRLVACLRLVELNHFGEAEASSVSALPQSSVELGAFTLFVIQSIPMLLPTIQIGIKDFVTDKNRIEGTALGAVVHVMNLENHKRLARQIDSLTDDHPRNPARFTPDLKAEPSVPLLLHILDVIRPEGKEVKVEIDKMLYDLLRCAGVKLGSNVLVK